MSKDTKNFRFDKRASQYDGLEGRASRRFYSLLFVQIELFEGASVLDVGCGTGTILRKMADACPIKGFGIDMDENMIVEAKKKCPDINIQISSCDRTPFEAGQFDIISACMAYHHFSDKKGFAREAARILKPGGMLYICDPRFPWPVRKALNGVLRLLRVAGFFGTPREIYENFRFDGFLYDGAAFDGYAQVVKLKLNENKAR